MDLKSLPQYKLNPLPRNGLQPIATNEERIAKLEKQVAHLLSILNKTEPGWGLHD